MAAQRKRPEITFNVNDYDQDGDSYETGIFLHFGKTTRLKVGTMSDLEDWIAQLQKIKEEISESYPNV